MALIVIVAGLLVAAAVVAVRFVQGEAAQEQAARVEQAPAPGEDGAGQGFRELLDELLEDVLGEQAPIPGARPDLLACLSGEDIFGGASPPRGTLEQQVRALARATEQLRELRFQEPVEPEFLPPAETSRRVEDQFLSDYTARMADTESRILETLGAVETGTDLRQTRSETLSEQVVGFYTPNTGELVVQVEGNQLEPLDRVVLVHELEHALAHQNLDFPLPLHPAPGREDRDLAALSVLEGDATLTMQRYAFTLPFNEQLELADPSLAAEAQAGLADLPHFLEQELRFPYEDGLAFVCRLFDAGGWAAVNRAYAQPPTTSAQVLFPERYAADEGAVNPSDPESPGDAWKARGERELGAAHLLWLFEAPGGERSRALPGSLEAAGAWAGGEVHLWARGQDTALGVALAERDGVDTLCGSVIRWYRASFGDDRETGGAPLLEAAGPAQAAVIRCTSEEVHLGIGPDLATARRVAGG